MTLTPDYEKSTPFKLGISKERSRDIRKVTSFVYVKAVSVPGYTISDALKELDQVCTDLNCSRLEMLHESFFLGATLVASGAI